MIKHIIFDLDGTLLDTSRDSLCGLNASLKKFSVPEITLSQSIQFLGDGARALVRRAVGEKYAHLADRIYEDYYYNFVNCENEMTALYDGEETALSALASVGIEMSVITNKPQAAAEKVIEKHLNKFNFKHIIGNSEKFPLKPDPTSALWIIGRLGLKKEEVLFVGDGDADVRTAANAGIKCASVLWGFRTGEELISAGATTFARTYDELVKIALFDTIS